MTGGDASRRRERGEGVSEPSSSAFQPIHSSRSSSIIIKSSIAAGISGRSFSLPLPPTPFPSPIPAVPAAQGPDAAPRFPGRFPFSWRVLPIRRICRNEMRRVVVTGLGAVTPLGVGMCILTTLPEAHYPKVVTDGCSGVRRTWQRLVNGDCGIVSTRHLGDEFAALPSQVAGLVPDSADDEGAWRVKEHVTPTVR